MGRDKARLRLDTKTMLGQIRAEARKLGLPVRTIRRDLGPRCGPLGGVYTALKTSQSKAELFLACDMPFVSAALLELLLQFWQKEKRAVFVKAKSKGGRSKPRIGRAGVGFPFLVPVGAVAVVERQISKGQFALQKLARPLKAGVLLLAPDAALLLLNVNTRADWKLARQQWRASHLIAPCTLGVLDTES